MSLQGTSQAFLRHPQLWLLEALFKFFLLPRWDVIDNSKQLSKKQSGTQAVTVEKNLDHRSKRETIF